MTEQRRFRGISVSTSLNQFFDNSLFDDAGECMSNQLAALRFEAETVSGLMIQLAENKIDDDSFAVMSNLGENGMEYDCDLSITETALRASSVIDQLLSLFVENSELRERAEEAEQREKKTSARAAQADMWALALIKANDDMKEAVRILNSGERHALSRAIVILNAGIG